MATEIPTLTITFYACIAMGSAGFIAYPFFGPPIVPTTYEAIILICAADYRPYWLFLACFSYP